MKLVVGLGNPGNKYEATRHNVGFDVSTELARNHGGAAVKARFQAATLEINIGGEKVLLLQPQTYMNRSGGSVQPARDFYKLENSDILVVCDDFNLPLGKLRYRADGSAGGQKGLADIIRRLGSEDFPRLRIGIGLPPEGWDPADFVLSKFRSDEAAEMKHVIVQAARSVTEWVTDGIEHCMNRYNGI